MPIKHPKATHTAMPGALLTKQGCWGWLYSGGTAKLMHGLRALDRPSSRHLIQAVAGVTPMAQARRGT